MWVVQLSIVDMVVMLWVQKHTEIGPVLDVNTFCHLDKHGFGMQMFGWSFAEARTATWMSYDTRIQKLLPKDLKKPILERSNKIMQNDRLVNRELNAVQKIITFLFLNESGKTTLRMSTATCHQNSKIVAKLARHENRHDREADGTFQWILIR